MNKEISELLYQIAELLSFSKENLFRVRAYENAARVIESYPRDIEELVKNNELKEIPGIGKSIEEKITEYLSTGRLKYLDELKKEIPEGLLDIMNIPGMGPRKTKIVYENLKITSIKELETAARNGKLRNIAGFGEKTEENILSGIQLQQKLRGRMLLFEALNLADTIMKEIKKNKEVKQVSPAGSLRRLKETVRDIDILCTVKKNKEKYIIDRFTNLPIVDKVLLAGTTKASVISKEGIQIDLRVLEELCYGAALQYFTGSKEHNIALRELANRKGFTINEYGVFKISKSGPPPSPSGKSVAGRTEEEIYALLGLRFIPPMLRENRGEIESSMDGRLPQLINLTEVRGDTHVHSKYSDGVNTIEEIADKAEKLGYEWVIICDHSQSLKIADGVSLKDMYRKIDYINRLNQKNPGIKILAGTEVDILSDGKLDYPYELLKELDFVNAAVHTGFKQEEEQITTRIIRAMENKYVHCISHLTGRLIGKREPYKINIEKVLQSARDTGTVLEINAFPERLDLSDVYCKRAKEMGIKMCIGSDAHSIGQMEYLPLGVYVAQRGWLEKNDVINTMNYKELKTEV